MHGQRLFRGRTDGADAHGGPDPARWAWSDLQGRGRNGAAGAELYEGEHEVLHSSGELRWCYFRVSWVYDKNEGRYFYVAQVLDITDQKKVEHMKNEFVATVSHELRTPLTSIKGALGLIRATGGDDMPPPRSG